MIESDELLKDSLCSGDWSWLGDDEPSQSGMEIGGFVYCLWSPRLFVLKIGVAKNEQALKARIQEKIRQCGETKEIALDWAMHPAKLEKQWIDEANNHPFVEKLGTESFFVSDPSWLLDLAFIKNAEYKNLAEYLDEIKIK